MRRDSMPPLASLLAGSPTEADAFVSAVEAATAMLACSFALVYARDGARTALAAAHGAGETVRELAAPAAFDGLRTPLAASRVRDDERFPAAWHAAGVASLLAVPIEASGGAVLVAGFGSEQSFGDEHLALAGELAAVIGASVQRARLAGSLAAAETQAGRFARASGRLAQQTDVAGVLEALAEEAVLLSGADAARVVLASGTEAQAGEPAHDAATRVAISLADEQGVLTLLSAGARSWSSSELDAIAALADNAVLALANVERLSGLTLSRTRTAAVFASIADGIVAVDADGEVVLWNEAAESITGIPSSEAIGRTTEQVLGREFASSEGGATHLVSIPLGGGEIWLALSQTVMRDPDGEVAGRVFIFRDISAEHAVEQMKSDFVSSVSLELRAPLSSIYGFAQTLLREDVPFSDAERKTFIGFIASEAERVTETIDALLNVARLETGDLAVSIEPTDVVAVVDALISASSATGENGHRVVADLGADVPIARADPVKLRDVLDQLVSNAIRFSPDGGTVTVSARKRDDRVELAVSDEGVGIPLEERERIFAKFTKAESGTRSAGVGLFIAQGLVREMGGLIRVDSNEGSGSRFTFELPIAGE